MSETNVKAILEERGSRYGKFETHAEITQELKVILHEAITNNTRSFDADMYEAIDMICHKLGRIANGDPRFADSWVDIAGYAQLVADRIQGTSR
jgi:replication-associated recombination protein RarA